MTTPTPHCAPSKNPRIIRHRTGSPGPPSGRAHLGWWLGDNGVCRTDSARLTPLRYAHRLEKGLCISVGGDFAYGGQLTTNPIHPDWDTRYGRADPYAFCRDAPAPRSIVLLRPYVAV
ncbi:replication initiation protein [Rhodococcus sp. HM1]|uniref:replication initiation protein n=1 Tax=Rhodococcus TaxID=1827 RepID=UPI001E560E96|nr:MULTISPECIES: replication initiation protein [Rhodococcus]MCK8675090.1 replication initiation protein [Rhodococcus sp. HM1]